MNPRTIAFWLTTALVALANTASGAMYLTGGMNEAMHDHLGFPLYFLTILGTWKLLGLVALMTPKFDGIVGSIKNLAYAGYFFTFTGAAWSHASMGDGAQGIMPPLVMLGLLAVSWFTRPGQVTASQLQAVAAK